MEHIGVVWAVCVGVFGALAWIGAGVWKIAQWTQLHDSRAAEVDKWKIATDKRLDDVETAVSDLRIVTARIEERLP
jgi:hypothetical protein